MIDNFDLLRTTRDVRLTTDKSANASVPEFSIRKVSGDTRLSAAIVDLLDPVGKGVRVTFSGTEPTSDITATFEVTATVNCVHNTAKTAHDVESFTVTKKPLVTTNRPPVLTMLSTAMSLQAGGSHGARSGTVSDPDGDTVTCRAATSSASIATASVARGTIEGQWIVTVAPVAEGTATITVTPNDGTVDGTAVSFTVNVAAAPTTGCPGNPTVAISGTGLARSLSGTLVTLPADTTVDTQYRLQGVTSWTTGNTINGSPGQTYQYRARARKTGCTTAYSAVSTVSFPPCPSDATASVTTSTEAGTLTGTTRISADTSGSVGTLAYVWRKDGTVITGQTGSSIQVTNPGTDESDTYRVTVTATQSSQEGCTHRTTHSASASHTLVGPTSDPCSGTIDAGSSQANQTLSPGSYLYQYRPVVTGDYTLDTPSDPAGVIAGTYVKTVEVSTSAVDESTITPTIRVTASKVGSCVGASEIADSHSWTITVDNPIVCPGVPTVSISGTGRSRTLTASLTNEPTGTTLSTQYRLAGGSSWTTGTTINGNYGQTYQYRARARKTGCTTKYSSVGSVTFVDPCANLSVSVALDGSNTIELDQGDSDLERGVTVGNSTNVVAGLPSVSRVSGSTLITAAMNDDDSAVVISVPSSGVTSRLTTKFRLSVSGRCQTDSTKTTSDTDDFTVHCDPPPDPCTNVSSPTNPSLRLVGSLEVGGSAATLEATADAGAGSDATVVSAAIITGAGKVTLSGGETDTGDDVDVDFSVSPVAEGAATIRVTFTPRTGTTNCASKAETEDINVQVQPMPDPCASAEVTITPASASAELRWTRSGSTGDVQAPSNVELSFTVAAAGGASLGTVSAIETFANMSASIRTATMLESGTHILTLSPVDTPSENSSGTMTVRVTGTCTNDDGTNNYTAEATVTVSIVAPPPNVPPSITPATIGSTTSRTSFVEGEVRTFTLTLSDPTDTLDKDDLSLRDASDAPFTVAFADIPLVPGQVKMTVTADDDAGEDSGLFYIRVTDSHGGHDETIFYWATVERPNAAPTWIGPKNHDVPQLVGHGGDNTGSAAVNIANWFSDPGDTLTYSGPSFTLSGAAWQYTTSGNTITFSRTPAAGGHISLTFTATDSKGQSVSGTVRFNASEEE